jgi:hypothetical protein
LRNNTWRASITAIVAVFIVITIENRWLVDILIVIDVAVVTYAMIKLLKR